MQATLSALVAHDIKNALALLEIDLEQLNHQPNVPVEGVRAYRRCVELKARLIGFLTLYKRDQSGLQPMISEVDLIEFFDEIIDGSQSVMMAQSHHGHPITVQLDRDRIKIAPACADGGFGFFDENLVELALESALNNALRYAHHKIVLWFEQGVDELALRVLDDGVAVEDEQRKIAENSSSTGLGLALCRAVAEAHGAGSVSLKRVAGGGTLFTMALRPVG